jgi:hypothetical protein
VVIHFHFDFRAFPHNNIHARAKFDHSEPFSDGGSLAFLYIRNDSSRYRAGDLFEEHFISIAFNTDVRAFVLFG